jgi:predicted amidophosphoribosyltransferase
MRQTDRTLNDDEDIAVFEEKHLCIVHKGPVDSLAFICPSCGSFYCKACFDAVVEADNACWSCGRPLDASKPSKRAEPEHQAGESQGKKAKKKTAINKDS